MGWGAAGALGTFAYGDETSKQVVLERRTLSLPNWTADGFRVGLITDIHADSNEAVERGMQGIRRVISEKPDVILFGGDYLTSAAPQNLRNVRKVLEVVAETTVPSFGIYGNHDYWAGYFNFVSEAVSSSTMKVLRNETVDFHGVRIIGVDDALVKKHRPDLVQSGSNTIALFHEPDFVDEMPKGISLQLSGHSHGGQICLPGGVAIHSPRGARRYVAGFYPDALNPLYVSRGIGTTGPNWRLFCPPEATILTLNGS